MFISDAKIFAALFEKIRAAVFIDEGDQWDGLDIFDDDPLKQVKRYDVQRPLEALEELLMFKNRLCVMVSNGWRYSDTVKGSIMYQERRTTIELNIMDRKYGAGSARQDALAGGATTPGALRMSDSIIAAIEGKINQPGDQTIVPIMKDGDPLAIGGDDRDNNAGRSVFSQLIEIYGGFSKVSIGRR